MSMPSPGMVGALVVTKPLSLRLQFRNAVKVSAEAAAGKDDRLGTNGVFAVLVLHLHADSLAVFHDQLGRSGVHAQVDLAFRVHVSGQHLDQIRAYRRGLAILGGGTMDTLDARAAEGTDIGQVRVLGRQPVNRLGGVAVRVMTRSRLFRHLPPTMVSSANSSTESK